MVAVLPLLVALAGALPQQRSAQMLDLDGRRIDPLADGHARATVFVFVSSDCPISNRYAPELWRLHKQFGRRGVAFWLVYPGRDHSVDAIRRHMREYGYPFGALRDPDFALVDLTGASVTPEAVVFDARRRLRYRGRIDDRYVSLARPRPAATRRDLEAALKALLAAQPIPQAKARAVGCLIADLR
jgi:hypothetical protein